MTASYFIGLGTRAQLKRLEARIQPRSSFRLLNVSERCIVVTDAGESPHFLPDGKGVIIGTVFHRHGGTSPIEKLEPAVGEAICRSRGEVLTHRFWGSYIAVIEASEGSILLRDPSGMTPCCYLEIDGISVFASTPKSLVDVGLLDPHIDWFGVARSLFLPGLPSERTAIADLKDLLPGTAIEISNGQKIVRPYWNPWDFVSDGMERPAEENVDRLRRVVESCIGAWGHTYEHGLVGISGGLDSSIVAATLRRIENQLSCLTLVTEDPIGDERPYCRALTEHLDVPLVEEFYSLEDINLDQSSVNHRPRPLGRVDALAYDAALIRTAASSKSNGIFTGNGGDNVFYMSRSSRALADRYRTVGLSAGLWRTVEDISKLTGATVIQVISGGIRACRRSHEGYVWRSDPSFLSRDAIDEHVRAPTQHPWLAQPRGKVLPGKAAHIAMLMRIQHSVEAYDQRGGVPVIHPLVSQPIVELCLGIPTWQQCEGGRDRSVARRAFERHLPSAVVKRRVKGSPQGFAFDIFRTFHQSIRERLLDGHLIRAGIIDHHQVDRALRPDAEISNSEVLRLLLLVDTEAWISHWRSKQIN